MDMQTFREQLAIKAQETAYMWRTYRESALELSDPKASADLVFACTELAAVQYGHARSHNGVMHDDQNYA